jgi:hypothetical protein
MSANISHSYITPFFEKVNTFILFFLL